MQPHQRNQPLGDEIVLRDGRAATESEVVLLDNVISEGLEKTAKVSEKIAKTQQEEEQKKAEKGLIALDALTNSLRTLREMKETVIGRLECIRALPAGGLPGERILRLNPGYRGFVIGLDGDFHEVQLGKTTLSALGEDGGFFRNLLSARTVENVTFFSYRTGPITVRLCWPDLNYLDATVITPDFIDGVIIPKIKTSEIRTADEIRGWVDADLQLIIEEPRLFFERAITGKRSYIQYMENDIEELLDIGDTWLNKNVQKGKLAISADYIYEATKRELIRAIGKAIFNYDAQGLYEDKDARDRACAEVQEFMSLTLVNIGLKLVRINNLNFHALEYEERLSRQSSLRIQKEIVAEEKQKFEIETEKAEAETAFKKQEQAREAELKTNQLNVEMSILDAEAVQEAKRREAKRAEAKRDLQAELDKRTAGLELEHKERLWKQEQYVDLRRQEQQLLLEFVQGLNGLDPEARKLAIAARCPHLVPVLARLVQATEDQHALEYEIKGHETKSKLDEEHHREMVKALGENRDAFTELITEAVRGGFQTLGRALQTRNRDLSSAPTADVRCLPPGDAAAEYDSAAAESKPPGQPASPSAKGPIPQARNQTSSSPK